jgi:HPt (histidine-containing phosphotransfer) domain-containing protein
MDFKVLGEQLGLDEDEYRELIELFIDSGGSDYQKVLDGLASGDADLVRSSAHTIKGASGNLGLMEVCDVASAIEVCAMNHQLDQVGQAVEKLKSQFEAIQAFARA